MSVVVSVDSSGGLTSTRAAIRLTAQEARSGGRPLDTMTACSESPPAAPGHLIGGLAHTADDQRTTAETMLRGALGAAAMFEP